MFPQFEDAEDAAAFDLGAFVAAQPQLTSEARATLRYWRCASFARMPADAAKDVEAVLAEEGLEFTRIAQRFGVSMSTVFRRIVVLSETLLPRELGLVVCDGSGTLMLRKPIEGFPVPRFSAACPKWPLFQALNRPLRPIRQQVTVTGQDARAFDCFAVAEAIGPGRSTQSRSIIRIC